MLKIILLICSFVLPIVADEANHSSFLDTGGVILPKVGLAIQVPNDIADSPTQASSRNLIIPTVSDNKSEIRTNVTTSQSDNKQATESPKIDSSKPTNSSSVSQDLKNEIQEAKPTASADSKNLPQPSVKIPPLEAAIIKPDPEVAAATKPETQKPILKPFAPDLPPPGPKAKVLLSIPTLPPPGPKKNISGSQPPQVQTAQQESNVKPEEGSIASTAQVIPIAPSAHETDKVQIQISNVSQQAQKPNTSNIKPAKTPIPKPPGWTFKEKIKSYSIIRKTEQKYPKQFANLLETNQQTVRAKKPAWSFKKIWSFKNRKSQHVDALDDPAKEQFEVKTIWSFKKKKNVQDVRHASNNPSRKPTWSFKKIWSFKKKGEAPNLEPIDLIPPIQLIQEAKKLEENSKKPVGVTKSKKIQIASNTRSYSIKEKDNDLKDRQALDFQTQELKVIKAKDYDDSLDRLRYNEYVKLFWSKFSTKREKEKASDIKGYLENYYKYYLDKKQKRRN